MELAAPQPFRWQLLAPATFPSSSSSAELPPVIQVITTAASVHLDHLLRQHLRLGFLFQSSLKKFSDVYNVPRLKDELYERASCFKRINLIQFTNDAFASSRSSCLYFFNGEEDRRSNFRNEGKSNMGTSRGMNFSRRKWTNILLATNVLFYLAQVVTQGKLLLWGAKVNSLIDRGQLWRLVTSSLLHVNIGHLMINCYSLNSIGPTVEKISGPKRFLAVYFGSAIASAASSYWFCKSPAVGASGAIFGLVGSLAVFVTRHRGIIRDSREELKHIAQVILLNMVIGLATRGIDNWGHLGGLLGGSATSWLLGPAWKYQSMTGDGRRVFADRAPIFYLTKGRKEHR